LLSQAVALAEVEPQVVEVLAVIGVLSSENFLVVAQVPRRFYL